MTLLEMQAIDLRIFQVLMAGMSSHLAAPLDSAGTLGSIGVGATDSKGAGRMIRFGEPRSINANLFLHPPTTADSAPAAAWLEKVRPSLHGAKTPTRGREPAASC
jgi:nitronate monooxygenase